MLEALAALSSRLDDQDAILHSLGKRGVASLPSEEGKLWTEVVKKQKVRIPAKREPIRDGGNELKNKRMRPPAIFVDVKKEDFPAISKKIRGNASLEVIGDHIIGMRQAKSGGLLIHVRGDSLQVEAVRAEVSRSAGAEVDVRALQQRALLEIRDLDEWTTEEDVATSLTTHVGNESGSIKILGLRKQYGGAQTALVSVDKASARMLLEAGRLRVGMVSCHVRERATRCFRCMALGHVSSACGGTDRSKCCRRCGLTGHFAKDCGASDEESQAFRREVQASESDRLATISRSMRQGPRTQRTQDA